MEKLLRQKLFLDSAYDEVKVMSLDLLSEADSLRRGTVSVCSEAKSLGVHLFSEAYDALKDLGADLVNVMS